MAPHWIEPEPEEEAVGYGRVMNPVLAHLVVVDIVPLAKVYGALLKVGAADWEREGAPAV